MSGVSRMRAAMMKLGDRDCAQLAVLVYEAGLVLADKL